MLELLKVIVGILGECLERAIAMRDCILQFLWQLGISQVIAVWLEYWIPSEILGSASRYDLP